AARMRLGKMRQPSAAWHCRGNCNKLLICLREFRQRFPENFRIRRRWRRCGLAALDLVFAEPVKFIRLLECRSVAFALLRQDMQQHRLLLCLQKLKCPDEQRNVVSIDRPVITEAELLENNTRYKQAFDALFDFMRKVCDGFSGNRFDEMPGFVVKMRER